MSASQGAGSLLGSPVETLIGRDLFRDIAPAMATPACLGRFLEGVRTGFLDDAFTFVFGRETGSLELRVRMQGAPTPDLYRIHFEIARAMEPSRHREAMLAVDSRARAETVDPIVCEQEPIHVPGSIQPPNGLVCVDPETFVVTAASENIVDLLGIGLGEVLGRPLADVMPAQVAERLAAELATGAIPAGTPTRRDIALGTPPRTFALLAHVHDGRLVLELETAPVHPQDYGAPSTARLRQGIQELRRQVSVADLARSAADFVREMTGYERVLVYRFDPEWNGEAIAESIVEDWDERLLGLRFPASDIPRQARELYRRSPTRIVIDRDAAPVRLQSSGADNRPIDLTFAAMRSLSPIHIEYQRNLGVNGSMSVAILIGGRLWGLVIGHHRRPHYVAPETRDAVAIAVDALALLIHDREREATVQARNASFRTATTLVAKIAAADDFVEALVTGEVRLDTLFGSTGAAVVAGDRVTTTGDAPPVEVVAQLAEAIRPRLAGGPLALDHVEDLYPPMAPYRDVASGVLAAAMEPGGRDVLIWFRPEMIKTVTWGGDPSKTVLQDQGSSAILPRRSFERWVETQQGFSPPWASWTLGIAESLAQAVKGVALRVTRRVAELSANNADLVQVIGEKDRLLVEKDLLTREIDHRVKNSLQIVSSFLLLQGRKLEDENARAAFDATYARVMSIARVHDSLYQSGTVTEVDLGQTIETLCRDLSGVGGEGHRLELAAEKGLMVPYQEGVALSLIATELVTNAWKYAYPDRADGPVQVSVGRDGGGGLQLRVADQGAGLPHDWDRRERRGLGMQLIGAMLSQIQATMDVDSGSGTAFTIRL